MLLEKRRKKTWSEIRKERKNKQWNLQRNLMPTVYCKHYIPHKSKQQDKITTSFKEEWQKTDNISRRFSIIDIGLINVLKWFEYKKRRNVEKNKHLRTKELTLFSASRLRRRKTSAESRFDFFNDSKWLISRPQFIKMAPSTKGVRQMTSSKIDFYFPDILHTPLWLLFSKNEPIVKTYW
jgi:hypothetical protein